MHLCYCPNHFFHLLQTSKPFRIQIGVHLGMSILHLGRAQAYQWQTLGGAHLHTTRSKARLGPQIVGMKLAGRIQEVADQEACSRLPGAFSQISLKFAYFFYVERLEGANQVLNFVQFVRHE